MKKTRKYAIGGKVTKKDLDKSSMKPDDSNSFNPTSIISGISKKNVKVKKMNRGTGFYKGTENKLAKHSLKKKKLGVDKFNEKINNVAQPLIAGASLAGGIASGFGGAGGGMGDMSKLAGASKVASKSSSTITPKSTSPVFDSTPEFNLEPGQMMAKKGLHIKKSRKYKSKKK